MLRRTLLYRLGGLCAVASGLAGAVGDAHARRPARPIARPPGQRPERPLLPGRFGGGTGGVAGGPAPGLFTVVAVDTRDNTMQLRDDDGRSGTVHVEPEVFDLSSLKAGDLVEVDFVVPEAGSSQFEAAGVWPVQR